MYLMMIVIRNNRVFQRTIQDHATKQVRQSSYFVKNSIRYVSSKEDNRRKEWKKRNKSEWRKSVWLLRSLKSPAVAERSSTSSAQSAVAFSLAFHSRADDRVSGVAPPASTPGDYEFLVSSFNCGAGTEKQRRTRTNVDEIILSGKLHVC